MHQTEMPIMKVHSDNKSYRAWRDTYPTESLFGRWDSWVVVIDSLLHQQCHNTAYVD